MGVNERYLSRIDGLLLISAFAAAETTLPFTTPPLDLRFFKNAISLLSSSRRNGGRPRFCVSRDVTSWTFPCLVCAESSSRNAFLKARTVLSFKPGNSSIKRSRVFLFPFSLANFPTFEIVVYFSVTNAKSGNQEVICYHFHSFQILHKLVHGALSHFRCWTDAKWHLAPSVLPKWFVERGFTRLKQMIYKFSVCLSWTRHYTLHINVKNAMEIGRA